MITWNWPMNQITTKVSAAIATGCTMVFKPSEISPYCSMLLAEVMHKAGVPNGVFNLVNGYGPIVGAALSEHEKGGHDVIYWFNKSRYCRCPSFCNYSEKSSTRAWR